MSEPYRYILEPYNGTKTRHHCPNCKHNGVFTNYIDLNTKEYVNDKVGRCNRQIKCGYHYTPKQYFLDHQISNNHPQIGKVQTKVNIYPKPCFIDTELLVKSKHSNKPNFFIDYLANIWDYEDASYLAEIYHIGTSKHWEGATVFWQVDVYGNVRSGKIMLYNPTTGKRIKQPFNHINWVHKVLKLDNFNLEQCYFGEHLLNTDPSKPVAIVESEKTAVISSNYMPEFIWLACGSLNNLNRDKTKVLKGRNVVLFPDLGCYESWNNKIQELTPLASFRISALLENKATEAEKQLGLDIADYLVKIKP